MPGDLRGHRWGPLERSMPSHEIIVRDVESERGFQVLQLLPANPLVVVAPATLLPAVSRGFLYTFNCNTTKLHVKVIRR